MPDTATTAFPGTEYPSETESHPARKRNGSTSESPLPQYPSSHPDYSPPAQSPSPEAQPRHSQPHLHHQQPPPERQPAFQTTGTRRLSPPRTIEHTFSLSLG